jgi:4-amino-4-deoxy-L-arabinose transferase-like glycosyltransferase
VNDPRRHRARWTPTAAVVVACLLRLLFSLGYWVDKPLTHDEHEYLLLARNLAAGRGFDYGPSPGDEPPRERFGRAPLYPAFLALLVVDDDRVALRRIKIVQSIVGALTVPLFGWIAHRAAGPRARTIALWLAAAYPPFVWMPAYVLSETLYMFVALGGVWWLGRTLDGPGAEVRTRPLPAATLVTAGVLAGLAALVRPAHLFYIGLVALWLLLRARRIGAAALIGAGALLVIGPWTVRNLVVHERLVIIASEGGVTFWTGNHPLSPGEGDMAANPAIKRDNQRLREEHPGLDAEALEPIYYREALVRIAEAPAWWLSLLARKLFYLWIPIGPSYTLHSTRYVMASLVSYGVLLPLGLGGLVLLARRGCWPRAIVLLAGATVLAALVFLPQERFRAPTIDPMLLIGAAALAMLQREPVRAAPAVPRFAG